MAGITRSTTTITIFSMLFFSAFVTSVFARYAVTVRENGHGILFNSKKVGLQFQVNPGDTFGAESGIRANADARGANLGIGYARVHIDFGAGAGGP